MGTKLMVLGYQCKCGARVPVYQFAEVDGRCEPERKPQDLLVNCPQCYLARTISVADIQNLDRWNETAAS